MVGPDPAAAVRILSGDERPKGPVEFVIRAARVGWDQPLHHVEHDSSDVLHLPVLHNLDVDAVLAGALHGEWFAEQQHALVDVVIESDLLAGPGDASPTARNTHPFGCDQ